MSTPFAGSDILEGPNLRFVERQYHKYRLITAKFGKRTKTCRTAGLFQHNVMLLTYETYSSVGRPK